MTIMKLLEYKCKSISSTIFGFTSIIFTTLFSTSLSLPLSLSSSPLSSFASTHLSTLPYTHQTDRLSLSKFCAQPSHLPTPTSLTALASFPGSGNTWIRYLIQQSSGYLTGSVYHDAALSIRGFPGEGISNGSMIVIKTHEHGTSGRQPFSKAIFLLRNPFKVLLSEFNRRSGGHLGHAPVSKLNDTGWRNYVLENVDHWSSFTLDWLNFEGPLLITRYEDFLNNLQSELNRVLNFLGVNSTQERLDCVVKHRNGWKRRPQHFLPFDPFAMASTSSSTNMTESNQAVRSSSVVPSLRQVVERKRKLVYQAVNKYLHQSGQSSSISELP